MTQIYTARYLVPLTGPPIESGGVLVVAGRIAAVAPAAELLRSSAGAERIDFGDAVLLPPLVNAHTHLELTDFPAWAKAAGESGADPGRYVDWLLRLIRVKRAQTTDHFAPSIARGLQSSLAAGTGVIADILSIASAGIAYRSTPLLGTLFYETLGRDPALTDLLLGRVDQFINDFHAPHLRVGLSPHSPYTLSADYLEQVFAYASRRGCPTTIHLAEPVAEVDLIREGLGDLVDEFFPVVGWDRLAPAASGLSPVAYLEAHHALHPETLLVHGVQVDEADVQRLRRHGCSMILCPRSNEKLKVGRAPVQLYRAAGVPLALGTDSLASNDSLSIWDELSAAARIYGAALTPDELLQAATVNGARLLCLEDEIGALQAGRGAHFQVVDIPDGAGLANLTEALVCDGRRRPVRQLYLHGKPQLPN